MSSEEEIKLASEELVKLDVINSKHSTYEALIESLSERINHLINNNFSALVQLLYRLDISENKLKALLANDNRNSAILIAELIVERQLQKIKTRNEFIKATDISEDEKW